MSKIERVHNLLKEAQERRHSFCVAACAIRLGNNKWYKTTVGNLWSSQEARLENVSSNHIFDLASVSKSITSALLLHALSQKGISVKETVNKFVSGFAEGIKFEDLLSYKVWVDSNEVALRELQVALKSKAFYTASTERVLTLLRSLPFKRIKSSYSKYNDLPALYMPYMLVDILQRDKDPRPYFWRFWRSLGMNGTYFARDLHRDLQNKIALPELRSPISKRPVLYDNGRYPMGAVFPSDEKAHMLMYKYGIYPGSAGIYSTLDDMILFLDFLRRATKKPGVFSEGIIKIFNRQEKPYEAIKKGCDIYKLGFRVAGVSDRMFGDYAVGKVIGQAGFSGSFFALDTVTGRSVTMLSNRIYPSRNLYKHAGYADNSSAAMNELRRAICNIVFSK